MHAELLQAAAKLICPNGASQPSEAELRRAVSTCYYALFHFVSFQCVDLIFRNIDEPLTRARMQAYRSVDHKELLRAARDAVAGARHSPELGFPQEILDFASIFVASQKDRIDADYAPSAGEWNVPRVQGLIGQAETAISAFSSAPMKDRLAFAVLILMKSRRA